MIRYKLSLKHNWKGAFQKHQDLIDMVSKMEKEYDSFDSLPQETLGWTTYVGIKLRDGVINYKTMEIESIPVYFTYGHPDNLQAKEIGIVKVLRK